MSYVVNKDGTYKEVLNLGWLLRNWDKVEKFEVKNNTPFLRLGEINWEYPQRAYYGGFDSIMIASLKDERFFVTQWASYQIMLDWLHRPKFIGLPIKWFGWYMTIGENKEETLKHG